MDYDVAIVGSGFGGSVAALRLCEKGYRVAVIEQGRELSAEDIEEADHSPRRLLWFPPLGLNGYFSMDMFRHVSLVRGIGVGGGSHVYAAVLLQPQASFYEDPSWANLGVDWKAELAPHYRTANKMLGCNKNLAGDIQDQYLRQTAEAMGAADTFGPTPNGIYFGDAETLTPDPYFNGAGPHRQGCRFCGQCLTGCPYGAKNTLDWNYLYLARRLGATILPERRVFRIEPSSAGGYVVYSRHPVHRLRKYPPITAKKVILAAGVMGTLELLFYCRDVAKTLPGISRQLGSRVRTNSETIVGALSRDEQIDLSYGTAISSHFYPDEYTHITQNRFPRGYRFMKYLTGPMVDHKQPAFRALKTLGHIVTRPSAIKRNWVATNWHQRVTMLTVMQHMDNRMAFTYGRKASYFFGRGLKSVALAGKSAPTHLPVANRAARTLADLSGGDAISYLTESIGNTATTAHILGGCHMGRSPADGVINTDHEVFGCPGLYVVDGAAVSANIGVNPSLTITAMAERAMQRFPSKSQNR